MIREWSGLMINDIDRLKTKLSKWNTKSFVGLIANDFLHTPDIDLTLHESTGLDSPMNQMYYLVGLLLSTEYTGHEETIDSEGVFEESEEVGYSPLIWDVYEDVKKITAQYMENFWPSDGTIITEEWKNKTQTMLPVFLSYFNENTLCHEQQVVDRIRKWFSPFDQALFEEYGFDSKCLIDIYDYVKDSFKQTMDGLSRSQDEFLSFLEESADQIPDVNPYTLTDEERAAILDRIIPQYLKDKWSSDFSTGLNEIFTCDIDELKSKFGAEIIEGVVGKLAIGRGKHDFVYYTDQNPIYTRPLIKITDSELMVLSSRALIDGIYLSLYEMLEALDGEGKIKFYKKRGDVAEQEVLDQFKQIFGKDAEYYTSVCQTPKNDEHDILVVYNNVLIIVEIKSSKVKEPRRNPEQGYKYVKEHYNSKKGIGGGYHQANKLRKFINEDEVVTLYNNQIEPFELRRDSFEQVYLIVITSEQFGPLNVNSFDLINKEDDDPEFWSCDMYNLDNLVGAFNYFGKDSSDFIKYIDQRVRYHKKFVAFDELDIAEYFLVIGDYESDPKFDIAEQISFLPAASNIYDKIMFEELGVPYNYSSDDINLIMMIPKAFDRKIGRNEKCPCGSGIKYKKCHGR